ncbi:unnamed protein product, partial [Mesorhabditis belari]|uniref:Transthyretin-like family protein n=1 Tax=Mesorhabditis belari TaxID=2138241 RepID=A0AAF3EWG5_9BILA
MYSLIVLASLLIGSDALFGFGFEQTVSVRGRLMCNGRPAQGVIVKMYDKDLLFDSKMGETITDSDGFFSLVGHGHEITDVDAKVNFYHNCESSVLRCKRKFSIFIPDKYITRGSHPSMTYDFHQMELAGRYPDESHDCLHRRR